MNADDNFICKECYDEIIAIIAPMNEEEYVDYVIAHPNPDLVDACFHIDNSRSASA